MARVFMLIVTPIHVYKRASEEKSSLRAMLWLLFTRFLHDRRATVDIFRFNSNVKGLTSGDALNTSAENKQNRSRRIEK